MDAVSVSVGSFSITVLSIYLSIHTSPKENEGYV